MEYDLINDERTYVALEDGNDEPDKIYLTLWRNPFYVTDPEKLFAKDLFANFTLSLVGLDTEYNFSKSVISGLSNKILQILMNNPASLEWVIDLKMDQSVFHKGMQILAGMSRVPFLVTELPALYCLINKLDIFDTSFKNLLINYLEKNCSEDLILTFIQTFNSLDEPKMVEYFLEELKELHFKGFRELVCQEPLSLETLEKIFEYHHDQRMKMLFEHQVDGQQGDVFLHDKEVEFVIENYIDKFVHPMNKASIRAKLMERFLPHEKKVEEEEEVKHDENYHLRKKNQELEERLEKLTLMVQGQQFTINSHVELIKKLSLQVNELIKKQDSEDAGLEDPLSVSIKRSNEFSEAAELEFVGATDAICLQTNQTVKLVGIEACLPGEKGITAAGEIAIFEWDYFQLGQEIARMEVELDYKEGEKTTMLWLEKTVVLKADRTYCLTCKMFGGPTFTCKAMKSYVSTKGLNVVFIEPDGLIEQFRIGANVFPGFQLQKIK